MKDFIDVAFDRTACNQELNEFRNLLESKDVLSERRDLQPLFKACNQLTAYIGMTLGVNIGIARQVAYEFELSGDYSADIVIGNRGRQFCCVELEDGGPKSVLAKVGKKATKEWGQRLEHGFSQLVDWFYHLDDFKNTARFQKNFGYGHISFTGLLLVGRSGGLDEHDVKRLRWRSHKVLIDSHAIVCMTFDELYRDLKERFDLYEAALPTEPRA
jgi:hypothetical protein